jgi:hypothetical protein
MDTASRKQYLETLLKRYLRARKRQKGLILDEYCRNTGQNRKYVIRKIGVLAWSESRPPRKRAPRYGQETARALEKLWKIFDYPCGQRLRPLIETELERLRRLGELKVSGRPKRPYEAAKTPYHRLIESGRLSPEKARELKELYLSLNPAELKRQTDRKLDRLYDLGYLFGE